MPFPAKLRAKIMFTKQNNPSLSEQEILKLAMDEFYKEKENAPKPQPSASPWTQMGKK